jgi:hypothetical protein
LTEAIAGLIRAPERAAALGAAARESVAARFSFDRMVAAFEDLYLTELDTAGYRMAIQQTALAKAEGEPRRGTA